MSWRRPINEPAEIVRCLVEQVTGTVRWRESVALHGASRRDGVLRSRRRQGAHRLDQAYRAGGDGVGDRRPGRHRPVQDRAHSKLHQAFARTTCSISPEKPHWSPEQPAPSAAVIARMLHAQGATVAISGHPGRSPRPTRRRAWRQRVHVLPCNLADAAAVEALVTRRKR